MFIGAADVVEQYGARESDSTNEKNIVGRRAAAWFQVSEELARQHPVPAHAKEQARGAESARQSAAKGRHNEDKAHRVEQKQAADPFADVHVRSFKIWERV